MFPAASKPGPFAVTLLASPWALSTFTSNGLLEICCPAKSTVTYKGQRDDKHSLLPAQWDHQKKPCALRPSLPSSDYPHKSGWTRSPASGLKGTPTWLHPIRQAWDIWPSANEKCLHLMLSLSSRIWTNTYILISRHWALYGNTAEDHCSPEHLVQFQDFKPRVNVFSRDQNPSQTRGFGKKYRFPTKTWARVLIS